MAVSHRSPSVAVSSDSKGVETMKRRHVVVAAVAAVLALGGATFALGGGIGLIWDDGHYAQPGSLDDGKELLPQTKITLDQAVAAAQRAAAGPLGQGNPGQLGQVDLEHFEGRIVYMVDVGDQEVRVDALDGSIAAIGPRE